MKPQFGSQKNGYDRQQVDAYVDLLRAEYDRVTQAYRALEEKAAELEEPHNAFVERDLANGENSGSE